MANTAAQEYGGFWVRFLAFIIDCAIVAIAGIAITAAVFLALGMDGMTISMIIVTLLNLLYWPVMQASSRQATFGKALVGLKVTDAGGERMSFLRAIGRELAKIISSIPLMLGFLLAAFTGRKQALHDMIASTYVVRTEGGHMVAAFALGFLILVVPVAGAVLVGGTLMALVGGAGLAMLSPGGPMEQAMKEAQKQAAVQSTPAPRPVPQAVPTAAKPAAPKPPVVAADPAPTAGSAFASAPPPPPKPQAAPVAAPPIEPKTATVAAVVRAPEPRRDLPGPIQVRTIDLPGALEPAPAKAGPKYNDLMSAVMQRDAAGVNEQLALGRWVDKPDSRGITPLMVAAMLGDRANAETLLKAGADAYPALAVARERRDAAMTALLERYAARK